VGPNDDGDDGHERMGPPRIALKPCSGAIGSEYKREMARHFQLKSTAAMSRLGIDYTSALNDEQRAVALAPRGPLVVLAGAGSGKTRAITYRVARFLDTGIAPERILLLTFTNRAAKEMLRRVGELVGPQALQVMGGTFHHVGNALLKKHALAIGYGENFTILDREDARELMAAAVVDAKIDTGKARFPKADVLLDLASAAINQRLPARDLLLQRAPRFAHLSDEIMAVCRAFVHKKASLNVMDFDDLLMNWAVLLEEGGALAEHIKKSFDAVLVDEYQDTNALQGSIVDLMAEPHRNVTVVGDDAQCIYGFRGAAIENIRGFSARWPGATTLPLQLNYRSTPEICALANATMARAREESSTRLRALRPSGMLPALVPCRDVGLQAEFVAERILQLRDEGIGLDQIAVLYRAHRHVLELQVELTRRGIPFLVRSGLRFFEQAHIKDVLCHLKLLWNADDELSFRRTVKLHDGIGNATADALWGSFKVALSRGKDAAAAARALVDDPCLDGTLGRRAKPGVDKYAGVLGRMGAHDVKDKPGEQIRVLLDGSYGDYLRKAYPLAEERIAEIEQLADYAAGFVDTETFLSELMLVQSFSAEEIIAAEDPDEKVTLSSVHQAKGLEWSRVFIVWATEGSFPSDLALKDDLGEDEERRLWYVAVTRAKDEVYVCHPQTSRLRDTSMVLHKPSRFVTELPEPTTDDDGTASGLYEPWILELVAPDTPPGLTTVDTAPAQQLEKNAPDVDEDNEAGGRFRLQS
jgi:DNA helicase-2/ATP-dependent DNA helicase PcrA